MKLSDNETHVLSILGSGSYDFGYFCFAAVEQRLADKGIKLDRKAIRRACRSLARKGLAEYGKGLWSDDGEPAGSGYCAKRAGQGVGI